MSDEISDDPSTATITPEEVDQALAERKQVLRFKTAAFYGVSIFSSLYLAGLFFWLVVWPAYDLLWNGGENLRAFGVFFSSNPHAKILSGLIIVTLAAIPTTMALAMLRFTFGSGEEKRNGKDVPGVWMSLAKELIDVFKQYVGKK